MRQLLLITILCWSSISMAQIPNFDYGHFDKHAYTNSFFNLQMQFPEDWYISSTETNTKLGEMGKDLVTGDDANMKAMVDANMIRVANLLSVFKFELGSPVEYNPGIVGVAENLSIFTGMKNGHDYLENSKKIIEQSQLEYKEISIDASPIKINGNEFYKMTGSISIAGLHLKQEFYVTIRHKFALAFIISYTTEADKNDLFKVLQTIHM